MKNEKDTPSEPCDDTNLDSDNQAMRDAKWRSEIDGIAVEAIRSYDALVEQAAKACPPSPPPSESFLTRQHLGRPWGQAWTRFEQDMRRIGLVVHEAATPGGWGGPSITVPRAQLDAVVSATHVVLEHHNVGTYVSVYPAVVWV